MFKNRLAFHKTLFDKQYSFTTISVFFFELTFLNNRIQYDHTNLISLYLIKINIK